MVRHSQRNKRIQSEINIFRQKIVNNQDKIWHPPLKEYKDIGLNTCFDAKYLKNTKKYDEIEFETDNIDKKKHVKAKKINLILTKRQKEIIQRWLNAYILTYNEAVSYIKHNTDFKSLPKIKALDRKIKFQSNEIRKLMSTRKKLEKKNEDLGKVLNKEIKRTKKNINLHHKRLKSYIDNKKRIKILNMSIDKLQLWVANKKISRKSMYDKIYNNYNHATIRTYKIKDKRDNIARNSGIPTEKENTKIRVHMLDCAIKSACTSFKSATTNYLKNNTRRFRVKYLKTNKQKKILDIEPSFIKKNQICPNVLGDIKMRYHDSSSNKTDDEYVLDTTSAVKLHYDRLIDRYSLFVPQKVKPTKTNNNNFICFDGGIRTFMTGVGNNGAVKFGTDISGKIRKLLKKMDSLNARIDIDEDKRKNKERLLYEKITNMVDEMHWKIINHVTENYGTILIGKLSTKDISSKKKSNISKMTKRIGLIMRHYDFRMRLKYKCSLKGVKFAEVDERYTSKMCSKCGNYKHDLGDAKKYKCNECGCKIDRDNGGAICIAIKRIKE